MNRSAFLSLILEVTEDACSYVGKASEATRLREDRDTLLRAMPCRPAYPEPLQTLRQVENVIGTNSVLDSVYATLLQKSA